MTRIVLLAGARAVVRRAPALAAGQAGGSAGWSHHPPMRTLSITIVAFNVTFGAAWSVLVLYASERLGMDRHRVRADHDRDGDRRDRRDLRRSRERRFSLGDIMRVGLLIETGTHLVLASDDRAARSRW